MRRRGTDTCQVATLDLQKLGVVSSQLGGEGCGQGMGRPRVVCQEPQGCIMKVSGPQHQPGFAPEASALCSLSVSLQAHDCQKRVGRRLGSFTWSFAKSEQEDSPLLAADLDGTAGCLSRPFSVLDSCVYTYIFEIKACMKVGQLLIS